MTARGSDQPAEMARGLTIGAVLERLRADFPDLTISKIRFLDTQGLVSPQRRESGYREYSEDDIGRLQFVLAAQRDKFWPLKVIRESLDAFDRGLAPESESGRPQVPATPGDEAVPDATALRAAPDTLRLTRQELIDGSDLTESALSELETFQLVRAKDDHFGVSDLAVARSAKALSAYGVQGRHLRAFRLAADREIGLAEQAAGTSADARGEVLAHCLALHVALVRAGLRDEA